MNTPDRRYSFADRLVLQADRLLRSVAPLAGAAAPARPSPAQDLPEARLDAPSRAHAAGLMRVNHTGEVCAQALYAGQAFTAQLDNVREQFEQAAREEEDHLAWCAQRLTELDSQPSRLNPIFYGLSFGIGAAAGLAGDRWSLGFVEESERQVVRHLESHLGRLPPEDSRSAAIVAGMRDDERAHADLAQRAGAAPMPFPVRRLMQAMARVMTQSAYRI